MKWAHQRARRPVPEYLSQAPGAVALLGQLQPAGH
jgi:hypothetical protein